MNKRLAAIFIAMASCGGALAQEGADSPDSYFDDFPVVLSASRLVQTVDEAPASVTVIDRDMIRASGVRELVDLFRLVPGMVVGQYKGQQPTLGFFGFADPYFRQLQVLVDGVSIYSPVWGGADWNQLPIALEDIERVEVVRGPNASTFGANSFLGVVNIITRDPAVEHGAEVAANIGGNGIRDALARYVVNDGDLRYRLTAGQRSDHGLDSYPDSQRSTFFNMRGHYRLSTTDEIRVQGAYVGGNQEVGVYATPNHTDGPRTGHSDAGSIQARWTRMTGSEDELWLQFSHEERNYRETLPYTLILPAPFGSWNYPLNFDYEYRRTDLELQNTLRLANTARAVWGVQLREDEARSQTYFANNDWQFTNLYRLFGNLEWRPAAGWIATAGAMLEKNSISGTSLSPIVAINHEFLPGQTLRLRAANARRTPTLYEAQFDWRYELPSGLKAMMASMPSPYSALAALPLTASIRTQGELEDERVRSRELSYLGQFADYHLNVEFGLFEHRLDKLLAQYKYSYPTVMASIDPARYGTVVGFANLDSAVVRGQSLAVRWLPWAGGQIYMTGSRETIHGEGPDAGLIESSGPTHAVSVLLSQDLPENWQVSCGYYRVGAMRVMSGGDSLPVTERVDVRLARRFRLGSTSAEAALIVQNATGGTPVFELTDVSRRTSWLNIRMEY